MQRIAFVITSLLFSFGLLSAEETWKAGASSIDITPESGLWMAGYGSRKAPAEGTKTPLHAKALALEDSTGTRGLIVTLDLVGIARDLSIRVTEALNKEYQLPREAIALCTSHTHSGPVVAQNLAPLHYELVSEEQQEKIDAYAEVLLANIVTVCGEAIERLAPARVQWGSGKSTFAVNRRNNKEAEVPANREIGTLAGPSDHDVPVLSVRSPEGQLQAILFGYACHATALSEQTWNADYPGYAQAALEEKHPGAVALFWAGCGGDQNPLPRRELALAENYGADLAARIDDVLRSHMPIVSPRLTLKYQEIAAPLADLPTQEQLKANLSSESRYAVGNAQYLLKKIETTGPLKDSYPYPIGNWTLGNEVDFIFLGGEVVVDYALRLKRERNGRATWVAGYSNDVMAYIPSRRVLEEGGYEGGGSNIYYGLPGLWHETIEETIIKAVNEHPALVPSHE